MSARRAVLSAIVAVVLAGCTTAVRVSSRPEGALVRGPNGQEVVTPGLVRVPGGPFVRQRLRVTAPSYRPLEIDLRWRDGTPTEVWRGVVFRPLLTLGIVQIRDVELILVPEHDAIGTWDSPGVDP